MTKKCDSRTLESMFADMKLSKMTTVQNDLTPEEMAMYLGKYDELMKKEKMLSKDRTDEYYGKEEVAEVYGVPIPKDYSDLQKSEGLLRSDRGFVRCRIAKFPFSRGQVRAAYYGLLWDGEKWNNVVIKEFIFPKSRTVAEYRNQSENSAVAKYLMEKYVEEFHRSLVTPLEVITSRVLKLNRGSGAEEFYNMELFLSDGNWKKWTNNCGSILEPNRDLLNFTVWSYSWTGGYLLVSDLQGVEITGTKKKILLTDPAVLCLDKSRFGPTNFDEAQMILCLEAAKYGVAVVLGGIKHSVRYSSVSLRDKETPKLVPALKSTLKPVVLDSKPVTPLADHCCRKCGTQTHLLVRIGDKKVELVRDSGRESTLKNFKSDARCPECQHTFSPAWIENLTKVKVAHILQQALEDNSAFDVEERAIHKCCGHMCRRRSTENRFGYADNAFFKLMGGAAPQRPVLNQKCCACTFQNRVCTLCTQQIRCFERLYLPYANLEMLRRVFAEVLADL